MSSPIDHLSAEFGLSKEMFMAKVKQVSFNTVPNIDEADLILFCSLAHKHNINPFTEMYAQVDGHGNIVPTLKIDGWFRIVNDHPEFDGVEFVYSEETFMGTGLVEPINAWIATAFYRKDRQRPIIAREYFVENYSYGNMSWLTHSRRRLRHASYVQAARMAFGISGVFTEEEATNILLSSNGVGNLSNDTSQQNNSKPRSKSVAAAKNEGHKQQGEATSVLKDDDGISELPDSSLEVIVEVSAVSEIQETESQVAESNSDQTISDHEIKVFVDRLIARATKNEMWDECKAVLQDVIPRSQLDFAIKLFDTQSASLARSH